MKQFRLYRFSLFVVFLLAMVHMPGAISRSNGMGAGKFTFNETVFTADIAEGENSAMLALYDNLHLSEKGLSQEAFEYAVKGYNHLKNKGRIKNSRVLTIIDFTKPSSQKRLFIVDVENSQLLFNTYVAHGRNTGEAYAKRFSNTPESFQSSLGFYVTTGTYMGKNGFSMQLEGMEAGINDKADERAIVMHGAPYVSEGFIRSRGYIGRSHGCPAVPESLNKPIIEKIKNGSCMFIYSNDMSYINRSKIINI